MKNKVILLISPEAWGQNYVSKHHYANYLAKYNTVYFLNPVSASKIAPFGQVNVEVKEIKANLYSVSYQNLIPRLNNLPQQVQKKVYKKQARQIQSQLNVSRFDLVWSFDPYRFFDQTVWSAQYYIYHTVDFHPTAKFEKEICQSSDFVLGVTQLVIDTIEPYVKKVYKISHAADIDNFTTDYPVSVPGTQKIKACYTGNFHKHIDYDILYELASQNLNIDFILIGPLLNSNLSSGQQIDSVIKDKLEALDNIHFIGSVPSAQLMSYLKRCDINLALFKKEYEKIHCNPHKLMAYFYSGNITVTNYIDEHKQTDSDIILMEQNLNQICPLIKKIGDEIKVYNAESLQVKRKDFALSNTYDLKIDYISSLIYNE